MSTHQRPNSVPDVSEGPTKKYSLLPVFQEVQTVGRTHSIDSVTVGASGHETSVLLPTHRKDSFPYQGKKSAVWYAIASGPKSRM